MMVNRSWIPVTNKFDNSAAEGNMLVHTQPFEILFVSTSSANNHDADT